MLVEATEVGFWDGHRRRIGARFDVPEDATASWFEPVDGDAKVPKKRGPKPKDEKAPETFSELAQEDGKAQDPKGLKSE